MKRGTTPTITISINGAKVDDIGKMFITIEQGDLQLDITEYSKNTEANSVSFTLTQDQTLYFAEGTVLMQIRAVNSDGVAIATSIAELQVEEILKEGAIAYG